MHAIAAFGLVFVLSGCASPRPLLHCGGVATTAPDGSPACGPLPLDGGPEVREVVAVETIQNQVGGNVIVRAGGDLTLDGQITGDLVVERGGKATINGMVIGQLENDGEVEVFGWVEGPLGGHGTHTLHPGAVVAGQTVE